MSARDREKWDARYGETATRKELEPSGTLALLSSVPPPASNAVALDLACGLGRNTFALARLGYHVVAADISAVALRSIVRRRQPGVSVNVVQIDVEQLPFAPASFDLVAQVSFLDRRALPGLLASVKPGGLFLLDTFAGSPAPDAAGPRCSDHRLQDGELRRIFDGWDLLHLEERRASESRATVLARRRPDAAPLR
jgi:SAM-dependent methyltransferase